MKSEVGGSSYGQGVTPWHLCESMQSSGLAHVDALRCDVIEYAFRKKGDDTKMIDDLEKAAHCATRAAEVLRKRLAEKDQPELFQPAPELCGECVQGYIQETGFDRCPKCNADGRQPKRGGGS